MNNNNISPVMSRSAAKPPMRPRSKSRWSFKSDKSNGSSHKRKESLVETAAEKKRTHMSSTTKANPNAAISEAQPMALALEKPTISSLKNFRCNDLYGNPINDPDQNNPTRWRMERPLDTIRSFEVAIDRAHAHRQSTYLLTDQTPFAPPSRRTSSHLGVTHQQAGYDHGARQPNAGYGASRSRESFGEFATSNGYNGQNSHHGSPNGNSPGGYGLRNDMRKRSDPALSRNGIPGVYPAVGDSRSKDTLNTGASSGSDQWNNSTGPTSEEGSVERVNGVARPIPSHLPSNPDIHPGYSDDERGRPRQPYAGPRMGGRPPPGRSYGNGNGNGNGNGKPLPYSNQGAPRPPMKESFSAPAQNIQLSGAQYSNGAMKPLAPQKRESWLKRRFSRNK